jgi:hypothetical protein
LTVSDVERITIISCQFAYLYNLIGFTLYKENKS